MRTVNIAELKSRLSAHIQHVRNGEEVLVCERNKPVARIIPCSNEEQSQQERELVAKGVLAPPLKKRSSAHLPNPPGHISDEAASRLWQEERKGR